MPAFNPLKMQLLGLPKRNKTGAAYEKIFSDSISLFALNGMEQ
jgi:hypothetical protein